jgi:hypothetical protein
MLWGARVRGCGYSMFANLPLGNRRRSSSLYSGISPGTSRRVSLEEDSRRRVVEDGIGAGEDGIHGSSAAT